MLARTVWTHAELGAITVQLALKDRVRTYGLTFLFARKYSTIKRASSMVSCCLELCKSQGTWLAYREYLYVDKIHHDSSVLIYKLISVVPSDDPASFSVRWFADMSESRRSENRTKPHLAVEPCAVILGLFEGLLYCSDVQTRAL